MTGGDHAFFCGLLERGVMVKCMLVSECGGFGDVFWSVNVCMQMWAVMCVHIA